MASKDEAPPGPLIRFLLWIDPAFFYWITCVLKFIAAVLDKGLLGPIFGYSITKGKRDERRWAEALPARRGAQVFIKRFFCEKLCVCQLLFILDFRK